MDHKYLVESSNMTNETTFGPAMTDIFPDIPEGYTRGNIHPDLKSVLNRLVGLLSETNQGMQTQLLNGQKLVEFTTMQNDNRNELIFHVVNYDVNLTGDLINKDNLKIQFLLPSDKVVENLSYSGEFRELNSIKYKTRHLNDDTIIQVELSNTGIYGLGVIELSDKLD